MNKINIRKFQLGDEAQLRDLLLNTIKYINSKDYTQAQIKVWSEQIKDELAWRHYISELKPFVAQIDTKIVGYADLQADGYIDHFYCHWQYQRKGIGKALMHTLIDNAQNLQIKRLYSQVSITAKPFYEHFGFTVTAKQQVTLGQQQLINFMMEKRI